MSEPFDLRETTVDDLKGRDLTPGMIARATKPKPTWFVERLGDNFVFPVEEKEAWEILYNRSAWKRRDFKFIGYSDGTTYASYAAEALKQAGKLVPEIAALKVEIGKYRAAEERLIIDEAVDMDGDPKDAVNEGNKAKVLRLRSILEKHETKLEALERQHRDFTSDVVKKATAAELEVAKANWAVRQVWPENSNIETPKASEGERSRILKVMGQNGY